MPPQTNDPIENYGGSICGGDLTEVFRRSCNTPFARTALELGPDRFQEYMARWGIGEKIPIDLPGAVASTVGDFTNIDQNLPLLAIRGFGQNDDQMVPIHMAMVAAAVANDGEMMKPFVVDAELDHDGRVIGRTQPEVWKRPISRRDRRHPPGPDGEGRRERNRELLHRARQRASAWPPRPAPPSSTAPASPSVRTRGSSPTRPAEQPKYAVAVMLKGTNAEISAGTGGRLAGPIAKAMLDAVFEIDPPDRDRPHRSDHVRTGEHADDGLRWLRAPLHVHFGPVCR